MSEEETLASATLEAQGNKAELLLDYLAEYLQEMRKDIYQRFEVAPSPNDLTSLQIEVNVLNKVERTLKDAVAKRDRQRKARNVKRFEPLKEIY